jgi:polyisoprenoid-binding protein YceI
MLRLYLFCVCTIAIHHSFAQKFEPVNGQSEIKFSIRNFGITVEGNFSGLSGEIEWNPDELESCNINLSVTSASVHTGIDLRDKHLRKEDFFNVNLYPEIKFQSHTISKSLGKDTWTVNGRLIMKGVSRASSIPFTVFSNDNYLEVKGNFTVNRNDFRIGGSSLGMSDSVEINVSVKLRQVDRVLRPLIGDIH